MASSAGFVTGKFVLREDIFCLPAQLKCEGSGSNKPKYKIHVLPARRSLPASTAAVVMPALTEPRPATTKSHPFVCRGGVRPSDFSALQKLFSESMPFVEQSLCEASQSLLFQCFEVFGGVDSGPGTGQLICLGRLLS